VRGAVPGHDLPPRLDERRDDQWLGVSVDSQGPGSILIAPRVRSPLFIYTMCSNIMTLDYFILNESVLSREKIPTIGTVCTCRNSFSDRKCVVQCVLDMIS
jgi:hypothetical protein